MKALSRSYLQFTQGVPTKMHFDTQTGALEASFVANTRLREPTVVYLNREYWCGEQGCVCRYSSADQQLPTDSYEEVVADQITSLLVSDSSFDGHSVNISCHKRDSKRAKEEEL